MIFYYMIDYGKWGNGTKITSILDKDHIDIMGIQHPYIANSEEFANNYIKENITNEDYTLIRLYDFQLKRKK